jgi:nucleotide-binding universal stress UspA family protein
MLNGLSDAGLPAELEVKVISVADVWLPPDPEKLEPAFPDPISQTVRKARARAVAELESSRALAERACEQLRSMFPKWKMHAKAVADSPAWGIIKEAAAFKAELIVLGSHGRSAVGRFFLGSVAQKVAAEAHRSIHVSRPRPRPAGAPLKIMIAIDGSDDSQTAVQAVATRMWPSSTTFWIITVIDARIQTALAWPSMKVNRWVQAQDQTSEEWVGRMLEHSAAKLVEAGLKVETDIFDGDPKTVLLREAEDWKADCIFLGGRGLQHGERLVLGTTATAVATRAHCSVEIVRPGQKKPR